MPSNVKEIGLGGIAVKSERLRALRPDTVKSLMESMKENGLLQPVVLRPKPSAGYWLVAGRHRLEAARKLKWDSIRATIFDGMEADEAELAEIDENLIRADLSPIERALHVARRKELYLKRHPKTKLGATGRGRGKVRKNCESNDEPDEADEAERFTEATAKATGQSERAIQLDVQRGNLDGIEKAIGTSLDKGDELDALRKLGDLSKERQLDLIERAKAGEDVSAKTELKKHKRSEREQELGAKIVALPDKKFGVILADPEWRFEPWSRETGLDRAADNHYPTSCTEVIAARDVPSIAAKDCALFLCATAPMLPHAMLVMAAWGFDYVTNWELHKDRVITGYWNRNRHEHLLLGVRGNVPCPAPGEQWDSVIEMEVGRHSEKPEAICEMIEAYFPNLPKIELNRRGPARPGWDAWGNEAVTEAAE